MPGFAVVDVETTGLYFRNDRILEIGVVLLDEDLREEFRWSTLVNPERAVTAEQVHGISATDVHQAPRLAEIADDLVGMLNSRSIVAHNAVFDVNFLMIGLRRAGVTTPATLPVVDTMRLTTRLLGARSLAQACEVLSITPDAAHTAGADAEAAAELLRRTLELDPWELPAGTHAYTVDPHDGIWRTAGHILTGAGHPVAELAARSAAALWPGARPHGRPIHPGYTRSSAAVDRQRTEGYLASLIARLPMVDDDPDSDAAPYLALLDEVLEDRLITQTEADSLVLAARSLGLSRTEVDRANTGYLAALAGAAWADDRVTDGERCDIVRVAALLGLPAEAAERALASARTSAERRTASADRIAATAGARVVFTGEMSRTRADLERQAIAAGLVPTSAISRKTSLLVIADPHSQSGKARKARDFGVRIVSEQVFDEVCAALG
jgi:DNA polymerase-3 subunit epsilon